MPTEGDGALETMLLAPTVTVMVVGSMFWTKDVGTMVGVTVMVDVRTEGARFLVGLLRIFVS